MKMKYVISVVGLLCASFLTISCKSAKAVVSDNNKVDTIRFVDAFRNEPYFVMYHCFDADGKNIDAEAVPHGFTMTVGTDARTVLFDKALSKIRKLTVVGENDTAEVPVVFKNKLPRVIRVMPTGINHRFCGVYKPANALENETEPLRLRLKLDRDDCKGDTCYIQVPTQGNEVRAYEDAPGFLTATGNHTLHWTCGGISLILNFNHDFTSFSLDTGNPADKSKLSTLIKGYPLKAGTYRRVGSMTTYKSTKHGK